MKRKSFTASVRLFAFLAFGASVILLTGAVKFGPDLRSRNKMLEQNREQLHDTLHTLLEGTLSSGDPKDIKFKKLAENSPHIMLSLLCGDLKVSREEDISSSGSAR